MVINTKKNYKFLNILDRVFVCLFLILNSISGLQINNISINSILMFLFVVFVLLKYVDKRNKKKRNIPKNNIFVFFIFSCIISCVISLVYEYVIPHANIAFSFLINCICYLIIFIILFNIDKEFFKEICEIFINGLIYAARVQVIWGILQMVLIYTNNININKILFVDILHSTISENWVMGFYTNGKWILRITGLNYENAIFAIVVCIGLTLEKNKIWKTVMTASIILSLSRTGWFMVAVYYFVIFIKHIKSGKKFSKNQILKVSLIFLFIFSIGILMYFFNDTVKLQINSIYYRIVDNSSNEVSGNRHLLYYIYGPYLLFNRSNIFQILFGYGIRCSGIPFSQNIDIFSKIGGTMNYTSAWAVESDVIGLLLGGGIITTLLYYIMNLRLIKRNNIFSNTIIIILFGGITYHFHSISYIILIFIFASIYILKENQKEGINEQDSNFNNKL
ncbi:MAG: hypothetical protein J6M60_02260 [Clostridia bacterium]|nr:hypothetical protein [Clostridia bacterium]